MVVNNADFKLQKKKKISWQIFYEEENIFNITATSRIHTHCVLESNTKCKQKFCLFTRIFHKAPFNNTTCFSGCLSL